MPRRSSLTTSQRGYGWHHQVGRKAALRALVEGTACPFCGNPMSKSDRLDFDHEVPISRGGDGSGRKRLTHSACNRSAGARLRWRTQPNRTRLPDLPPVRTSRDW